MSLDEVTRLLQGAGSLKYQAALGVAYGAGLRANEVMHLKVTDIDSERMIIRIEQGKGKRDRQAMLSPALLRILRAWEREGRGQRTLLPGGWLFPGQNPVNPISTRQRNRAFHRACTAAEIEKRVSLRSLHAFATHLLELKLRVKTRASRPAKRIRSTSRTSRRSAPSRAVMNCPSARLMCRLPAV